MRLQNIVLASLLGVASAFTIPEGTEDGVYQHHIDADGNDVHVKLANATNYDSVELSAYTQGPRPGRFKRAEDVPHCGAGNELNHAVSVNLSFWRLRLGMTNKFRTLTQPMPISTGSAITTILPSPDTTSTQNVAVSSHFSAISTTSTLTSVPPAVAAIQAASSLRSVDGIALAGPTMHLIQLAMATMMVRTSVVSF
jgi:hypothetical protein